MELQKAIDLFYAENKILDKEKRYIDNLIKDITGILPYALLKIRKIEDFRLIFYYQPIPPHRSTISHANFETLSTFLKVNKNKCKLSVYTDYFEIFQQSQYFSEIETHFRNLGWNCKVHKKNLFSLARIIISCPKDTLRKRIWNFFLSFFRQPASSLKLSAHPYR
jgi:hypothetical protein